MSAKRFVLPFFSLTRRTNSAPLRYGKSSDSWMTIGAVAKTGISPCRLRISSRMRVPRTGKSRLDVLGAAEHDGELLELRLALDQRLRRGQPIVVVPDFWSESRFTY